MALKVAIVGRPNVGKSTLFNRLVGKRLALVDDRPGVTRDRRYADGNIGDMDLTLIDTAGYEDVTDDSLEARMREQTEAALAGSGSAPAQAMLKRLRAAREAFVQVVDFVAGNTKASPNAVFAGSVPYLMLAGNVMAGWQMARALLAAEARLAQGDSDKPFLSAKIATARFYAEHLLSKAPGMRDAIVEGAESVTALSVEAF